MNFIVCSNQFKAKSLFSTSFFLSNALTFAELLLKCALRLRSLSFHQNWTKNFHLKERKKKKFIFFCKFTDEANGWWKLNRRRRGVSMKKFENKQYTDRNKEAKKSSKSFIFFCMFSYAKGELFLLYRPCPKMMEKKIWKKYEIVDIYDDGNARGCSNFKLLSLLGCNQRRK